MRDALAFHFWTYLVPLGAFVVGPAFGLLAALEQRARGRSAALGLALGCGASWMGGIVGSMAGALTFGDFPYACPSPWLEPLFFVPCPVAGALAWRAFARGPRVSSRRGRPRVWVAIAAAVLSPVLVLSVWDGRRWPARRHLPEGAVVLEEGALLDDFLGDFSYRLRARMDRAQLEAWMRALDVAPTDDPNRWGTTFADGGSHWAGARWEDGVATFESGSL